MYPLILKPAVKDYIWGGEKLKTQFGIETDLSKAAEAWTLSCHRDGPSVITNGEHAGKTLAQWIDESGAQVLGTKNGGSKDMPVLVKLIDAKDNLSVQVHPNEEYAQRVENEHGKTEAWYVLDCEENASLIYGFKEKITTEEFMAAIRGGTLLEKLNVVPVKKGDLFFIEAGTLHAIGKGILLAEVQQNSNSTYRVFDYNRLGADGKPRELHIEKAADVTVTDKPSAEYGAKPVSEKQDSFERTLLVDCPIFIADSIKLFGSFEDKADEASFHSLLALDGEFTLETEAEKLSFKKGESIFLPAGMGEYTLRGNGEVLRVTL